MDSRVTALLEYCKQNKNVPFLEEFIHGYPGVTERNKKEIQYFAKMKLKGIQELAKTLKFAEPEEVDNAIANIWFEFQSQWIRHNAVNNFNMYMYNTADPLFVLQSSVLAYYIDGIERFIPEEKLKKMKEIMLQIQYSTS